MGRIHTNTKEIKMGKAPGFLEIERIEEGYAPVLERLKHYR